jgi:hypothetical protein
MGPTPPSPPPSSVYSSSPYPDSFSPDSHQSIIVESSTMKDSSHVPSKHTRNSVYTKKRPSPHGIAKSRKTPVVQIPTRVTPSRKTPAQERICSEPQSRREAIAAALHRDGRLLEDEYRTEVLKYMYDMEACVLFHLFFTCVPYVVCLAFDHVISNIYGSATGDQVAHATVSGRLSCGNSSSFQT